MIIFVSKSNNELEFEKWSEIFDYLKINEINDIYIKSPISDLINILIHLFME